MEIGLVIIRAFTYVIIFTLIKFTVPKILGSIKVNKGERGKTYFDKKNVSNLFLIVAIFFTVLLTFLSFVPSNVEGDSKIILSIGIIMFCLIWYVLSLMYGLWFIALDGDSLIYRNYIGKKRIIEISSIEEYERKPNGKVYLFTLSGAEVVIEPDYADAVLFWLEKKPVKVRRAEKKQQFCVRPAKYQRVLSILCLAIFLSFFVLGVVTKNPLVTIVFFLLLVFGIWNFVYHYTKKYVVGNGYIEIKTMANASILIPFSEIQKVEIKESDNIAYLLFFRNNQKKPFAKINIFYENGLNLKMLAYQEKWIK